MADKVVKNAPLQETGESIANYPAGAHHINQQVYETRIKGQVRERSLSAKRQGTHQEPA